MGDEKKKKVRRTPIDWKTYNKELVRRGKNISNLKFTSYSDRF